MSLDRKRKDKTEDVDPYHKGKKGKHSECPLRIFDTVEVYGEDANGNTTRVCLSGPWIRWHRVFFCNDVEKMIRTGYGRPCLEIESEFSRNSITHESSLRLEGL